MIYLQNILVTGGCGFVGTHLAKFYADQGHKVLVFDNLSRINIFGHYLKNSKYNWDYLKNYDNITLMNIDITNSSLLTKNLMQDIDIILHTAGQTAVTTSVTNPKNDFMINTVGTFNILEASRQYCKNPKIMFCSTNKVYGDNVNQVKVIEKEKTYVFEKQYENGIPEDMSIDNCGHTPYGCSKTSADIYVQDYAKTYGMNTAIFRMSCIYGERQFGVEDQGWIAWFTIATLLNKPITIYGNGKQVRDTLNVQDFVYAVDAFINTNKKFNIGGGKNNTLSLLELLDLLKKFTNKTISPTFQDWRPSDQKVYISNIDKAERLLGWKPTINPEEGVKKLVSWVKDNKSVFFES